MVKEKDDNERWFDKDGYKKRAACVCVKNENENEVLLISSSRNNNHWIIPGGGIERNENPEDAAEREVFEEAGVVGRLGRLLGIFEVFENKERKHRTNVYIFIVDKEFDDWEEHIKMGRKRKWFNIDEAKLELEKHKPVQGSYLNLLKGFEKDYYKNSHNSNINYLNSNNTNNNNNNNRLTQYTLLNQPILPYTIHHSNTQSSSLLNSLQTHNNSNSNNNNNNNNNPNNNNTNNSLIISTTMNT